MLESKFFRIVRLHISNCAIRALPNLISNYCQETGYFVTKSQKNNWSDSVNRLNSALRKLTFSLLEILV